jgi:hypothetical protein
MRASSHHLIAQQCDDFIVTSRHHLIHALLALVVSRYNQQVCIGFMTDGKLG